MLKRQNVAGPQLVNSVYGNGVAGSLDELAPPSGNSTVNSDFSRPPEWVKILAIGLASSLVALIELAVCRSALPLHMFGKASFLPNRHSHWHTRNRPLPCACINADGIV